MDDDIYRSVAKIILASDETPYSEILCKTLYTMLRMVLRLIGILVKFDSMISG